MILIVAYARLQLVYKKYMYNKKKQRYFPEIEADYQFREFDDNYKLPSLASVSKCIRRRSRSSFFLLFPILDVLASLSYRLENRFEKFLFDFYARTFFFSLCRWLKTSFENDEERVIIGRTCKSSKKLENGLRMVTKRVTTLLGEFDLVGVVRASTAYRQSSVLEWKTEGQRWTLKKEIQLPSWPEVRVPRWWHVRAWWIN